MKPRLSHLPKVASKASTGILGFEGITRGGLPRGRTTVLGGGPGSSKSIFSLNFLAHGGRNCKERGIFVALEEAPKPIVDNSEGFGWSLAEFRTPRKIIGRADETFGFMGDHNTQAVIG